MHKRATDAKAENVDCLPKNRDLYIGGRWLPPVAGERRPVTSPSTSEDLGDVAEGAEGDIDAAVNAARAAFKLWKKVPVLERANILRKAAARLREHAHELAYIDALDGGNPITAMLSDVEMAATNIEYFASLATEMKGDTIPVSDDVFAFTVREPLGVIARIGAFNHPFLFTALKAACPLIAGNTVVIKPPEQTPLSSLRVAEIWSDLLPPGTFNVVTGGRAAGAALASHPGVAKVAVIGSIAAGRAVMRAASDTVKHLSLELGGKNALIVFPDAELKRAAKGVVKGMNFRWTTGQSCNSTSRVFVHENVYDKLLPMIVDEVRTLRIGLPTDPTTEMGCLSSQAQFERVQDYIKTGLEEGATLHHGGKRITSKPLDNGFFLEPTIFTNVDMSMRIMKEEIFGPVVSVARWKDEDALFDDVNALEYGLTASIWTTDLTSALRATRRIDAGYMWVNDASVHHLGIPFGGFKQSGTSREESIEEMFACTQLKSVTVAL